MLPRIIKSEKKNKTFNKAESNLKEKIKDFIELSSLKDLLFSSSVFYKNKSKVDFLFFEEIINKMNLEVQDWDGKLYLVYLPSWKRYNNKYSLSNLLLKNKVRKISKKNKIEFLDVDHIFNKQGLNNTDIYNLGIYGHYTEIGYKIIAEKIIGKKNN